MLLKEIFNKKEKKVNYSGETLKDEDFDFDLIEYYFKHKNHLNTFHIADNHLSGDVDLDELFMYVDRTHSKIGQQYLYNQLHSIKTTLDFEEQESLIDYFTKHNSQRIRAQTLLSKLNKREAYSISGLFLDKFVSKPKWFWAVRLFSIMGIGTLVLTFVNGSFIIPLVFICIINMTFYFWNKNNILVYSNSIPHLPLLSKIAKELVLMNTTTKSEQHIFSSIHSINELKNKIRFFKSRTGMASEIEAVSLLLWEIINILFLIEPQIVFRVLEKLDKKKKDIQVLFEYIGKIDSALSIAAMRASATYYCIPTILNTNKAILDFTDIYHPLIPNCVPNSLQIRDKSILLTGSNMSGKTTFIRIIALNVLLAQTLNTCFAKTFKLAQTRLLSAIRIADDLFSDKSLST